LTRGPASWRLSLDPEPAWQQHSSMRWLALGLLALAALSCGGDSFDPAEINLAGTWVFSATIQETSQDCNISEAPITFSAASPDSLVGQGGVGGTIRCSNGVSIFAADPYLEHTTVFLTRSGSTVRIERHGSLLFAGEIRSENRMSGTTTVDSLPGSWVAERQ
jgi:hypothetical protein